MEVVPGLGLKVKIHGELLAFLPSWELAPSLAFKPSFFHVPTLGVELATSCLGAQRSPPMSEGGNPRPGLQPPC